MIVVFKPMKGSWKKAIQSGVEVSEGRYYFKVDKSDAKEQLHFSLSDVEAYSLAKDLIIALWDSSTFITMLQSIVMKLTKEGKC